MKKFISLVLCVIMLVSSFAFLTSAKEVVLYDIKTVAENGTIELSTEKAEEGTLVFVIVTPADGYHYVDGSLKYGYDNGVKIAPDGAGNFCFKMPHDDITVTASFAKDPSKLEVFWNNIKPAGEPLLNAVKSLLPLLQAVFGGIGNIFKDLFSGLDIKLPF